MNWIPIATTPPPINWDVLVKGVDSTGSKAYAVVRYLKPSQDGYPGFTSMVCDCSNDAYAHDIDITPTHWCEIS